MTTLDLTKTYRKQTWSPRLTVNLGHRGVRLVEKVPPVLRVFPVSFSKHLKLQKLALIEFCRLFFAFQKLVLETPCPWDKKPLKN